MKLNEFIKELENISKNVDRDDKTEVQMADMIPVVKPILKDGVVYITDINSKKSE
jgi:hypothetical protein